MDGLAGAHGGLAAAEGCFHLAFEQNEGLLEVMAVRRWSAAGRDVHIDQAEACIGVFTRNGDGVSVADQADVREIVRLGQSEVAFGIVWRDRDSGLPG